MPEQIPAVRTVASTEEVLYAIASAWLRLGIKDDMTLSALRVLVAQWALETGWGASMWCYNLGNAKHSNGDGRDWCFFECGEELALASANRLQATDPARVVFRAVYKRGTTDMASVRFLGEHPYNAFRAYRTLTAGATDYLAMMHKRFAPSWPAVIAGDPARFSHAIRQQGYYTADEGSYTRAIVYCYKTVCQRVPGPLDPSKIPFEMGEKQAQDISDLVSMNTKDAAEEYLSSNYAHRGDTEEDE